MKNWSNASVNVKEKHVLSATLLMKKMLAIALVKKIVPVSENWINSQLAHCLSSYQKP